MNYTEEPMNENDNPFKKIKEGSMLWLEDEEAGLHTAYLVDKITPNPNDPENEGYEGKYFLELSLVTIQEAQ